MRIVNIYAGLISSLLRAFDVTLMRELMTIAPAFTMGLCGLSARERRTCHSAPDHKRNKPARLKTIFHGRTKSNIR